MSDYHREQKHRGANFLRRWSRRKRHTQQAMETASRPDTESAVSPASADLQAKETDLPDITALHEDSDIGMFLHENVSELLRRQAMRKLFHMGKFNVCDGLDDYADDYTVFVPLGDTVTAYQRLQQEREELARLLREQEQDATAQASDTVTAQYDAEKDQVQQAQVNDDKHTPQDKG